MPDIFNTARFRKRKDMGDKSKNRLEDGELYEYEEIDGEIHLFTCSAESVVLTKKDLETILALLN